MKTFTVRERESLFVEGAAGAVSGAVFLLIPGMLASEWPVGIGLASVIWFVSAISIVRTVYEIRVADEGTVEFVRLLGTGTITARYIFTLEGRLECTYEGPRKWVLRVEHARGFIDVERFGQAMEFVSLVQAHNPFVKIEGTWLMDTSQDQGLLTALSAFMKATTTQQKPDHPG